MLLICSYQGLKYDCICVLILVPTGNVTFHRQVIKKEDLPRWEKSSAPLRNLHVSSTGNIEDDGLGMLQVI